MTTNPSLHLTRSSLLPSLLAAALLPAAHAADPVPPQIQNFHAAQRPGTMFVDITFDLIDPDSQTAYILVECSSDGGSTYAVPIRALSGDIGFVTPGTGKKMVWNAWNDWAGNYTENAKIRLTVVDDSPVPVELPTPPSAPPTPNLTWIPPGAFNMSGTNVFISTGFWMAKFEVTQAEFEAVMGSNPSAFAGATRPVDSVTWAEAIQYCQKVTTSEQTAGRLPAGWIYRLPTEAEWEHACRAGTTTTYYFGNSLERLNHFAWFVGNAGGASHEVGSRAPNRWGLYDMGGNVWEWCADWYASLPGGNVTDPTGPSSGVYRVIRGGSWLNVAGSCASAHRVDTNPTNRVSHFGFRVVLAPGQ